jgi:RNA polymerase sigma factor (sigma-70 family)
MDAKQMTDGELLSLIQGEAGQSQQDAREELIRRYDPRLVSAIEHYLRVKNCSQPEEHGNGVRSSAWISILGHLSDLKEAEKFGAWAVIISLNQANRHLKGCIDGQNKSCELKDENLLPAARIVDYYRSRDAAIDAERMLKFAEEISPEFGLVFMLYNIHELDFDEIARRLGCNKERIRTLYYRGVRKVIAKFNYAKCHRSKEQELMTKPG